MHFFFFIPFICVVWFQSFEGGEVSWYVSSFRLTLKHVLQKKKQQTMYLICIVSTRSLLHLSTSGCLNTFSLLGMFILLQ